MEILKGKRLTSVFVNTGSQFFIKFLTSGASFILTLAVTHYLGVPLFGSVTKIMAFVSLFYLFVDFGMNAMFLKDFKEDTSRYFFNLLILRLGIAVLFMVIISLIIQILPYNPVTHSGYSPFEKMGMIVFSTTLITQAILLSVTSIFQKHLRYDLLILPQIASFLLFVITLGIGISFHNIYIILLSYFVSGIFFLAVAYPLMKRVFHVQLIIENFSHFAKLLFLSSFPVGIMLLFNLVYFHADTIILSFFKTNLDVGIYGFAYKIFEFVVALPAFFANSIYPVLLEHEQNDKTFFEHVRSYSLITFILSLLATAGIFLFAPLIVIVNQGLAASIIPLRILSFSFPIFFLTSILQWVLIIKNKKTGLLFIYLFSMVINVILNLIFIPTYGYIAASIITDISEGVVLLLIIAALLRLQRVKITRKEIVNG
jgi:O-antigen/teichoic acid export membrane protein